MKLVINRIYNLLLPLIFTPPYKMSYILLLSSLQILLSLLNYPIDEGLTTLILSTTHI
jgi:hypothetical protein